jgi:hypothetical protein
MIESTPQRAVFKRVFVPVAWLTNGVPMYILNCKIPNFGKFGKALERKTLL